MNSALELVVILSGSEAAQTLIACNMVAIKMAYESPLAPSLRIENMTEVLQTGMITC